jgi:hypothetical protein
MLRAFASAVFLPTLRLGKERNRELQAAVDSAATIQGLKDSCFSLQGIRAMTFK